MSHAVWAEPTQNTADDPVCGMLASLFDVRVDLVIERGTFKWCPEGGDRVIKRLRNVLDPYHPAGVKTVAVRPDQPPDSGV